MYRVWLRPRLWVGLTRLKRQSSSGAAEPFLSGSSGAYVEQMYEAWKHDPSSVHKVFVHVPVVDLYAVSLLWDRTRERRIDARPLTIIIVWSILEYRNTNLITCIYMYSWIPWFDFQCVCNCLFTSVLGCILSQCNCGSSTWRSILPTTLPLHYWRSHPDTAVFGVHVKYH